MRKHNTKFAQRAERPSGDRSNMPQQLAHSMVNDKGFQFYASGLLRALFKRAGIVRQVTPKAVQA